MTREVRDAPQFYLTAPSPCPYLAGQQERKIFTHLVGRRDLARTLSAMAGRVELDAVVIGGGDGTILTAVLAGLGRDKPLGILPLGSLNLFARDLGLPLDPIEAARLLSTAQATRIDLAEVVAEGLRP